MRCQIDLSILLLAVSLVPAGNSSWLRGQITLIGDPLSPGLVQSSSSLSASGAPFAGGGSPAFDSGPNIFLRESEPSLGNDVFQTYSAASSGSIGAATSNLGFDWQDREAQTISRLNVRSGAGVDTGGSLSRPGFGAGGASAGLLLPFRVEAPTAYSLFVHGSGSVGANAGSLGAIGAISYDAEIIGPVNISPVFTSETMMSAGQRSEFGTFESTGILLPGDYLVRTQAGSNSGVFPSSASARVELIFADIPPITSTSDESIWDTRDGNWSRARNWDPQDVPGSDSTAVFSTPESYTVNVGSQTIDRLRLEGGVSANPTLTNMDLVVGSGSLTEPGVSFNGGTFTLGNGTLTNAHAVLGESIATTVNVQSGVDWNNQGRLTVGAGGETEFNIDAGAEVATGATRIGDASNGAQSLVNVEGTWDTGSLAVGLRSQGGLSVSNAGRVNSDEVQIGVGGPGSVIVGIGSNPATPANLRASDDIVVGIDASGVLLVGEGDVRTAGKLVVGGGSAKGDVFVTDLGIIAEKGFEIGSTSEGVAEISGGAALVSIFSTDASVVGANAMGSLTVKEVVDGNASEFQVPQLVVGEFSDGVVSISEGGVVRTTQGNVIVGKETGSSGQIVIDGKASLLDAWGDVIVGGDDELPGAAADGSGEIVVSNGGSVSIKESLIIGGTGSGSVVVSGVSDDSPSTLSVGEGLVVGVFAPSVFTVEDGGIVLASGASVVGSFGSEGTGVIEVRGEASSLNILSTLDEVQETSDPGHLIVGTATSSLIKLTDGGQLAVADKLTLGEFGGIDVRDGTAIVGGIFGGQIGELLIGEGGELAGTGFVIGSAENDGGVDNFAGVVNPGFSPGTLTIDGNFTQGELGTTLFEIGGTLAGIEYDQVLVSGDASMEGYISIDFIDGFAPSEGDVFDLFSVTGATSVIGMIPVEILGLEEGFEFDFGTSDAGGIALVARNDGISAGGTVPEPSSLMVWLLLGVCVVAANRKKK